MHNKIYVCIIYYAHAYQDSHMHILGVHICYVTNQYMYIQHIYA